MCPGETYRQRCRPISEALVLQITLTGGSCTYNKNNKYEFDYNANDDIENETVIDEKCGKINGISTTHNNSSIKSIDITFQATKYIDQANLSCLAFLNGSWGERECIMAIADTPSPPTNISFSECTPKLISWEPPSVLQQGKADENLKYIVTLNSSSLGTSKTITTAYTYYKLRKIDTLTSYNICVAAVNCVGVGTPVCIEKLIGKQ